MTYSQKTSIIGTVEKIVSLDSKMRFAAIIDRDGNIVEAIMKGGKTSLKSQKEEEHFCKQAVARRKMRKEFDQSLGKVRYVHVERERVTQMVIYPKNFTVYFTMEPEMTMDKKLRIINRIKKLTSDL